MSWEVGHPRCYWFFGFGQFACYRYKINYLSDKTPPRYVLRPNHYAYLEQ